VFVFSGSAETSITRGGIINHHMIACSLSNISAKNYQNRLMCIEVIVCYISLIFLDTMYIAIQPFKGCKSVPIKSISVQWTQVWIMPPTVANIRQLLQYAVFGTGSCIFPEVPRLTQLSTLHGMVSISFQAQ